MGRHSYENNAWSERFHSSRLQRLTTLGIGLGSLVVVTSGLVHAENLTSTIGSSAHDTVVQPLPRRAEPPLPLPTRQLNLKPVKTAVHDTLPLRPSLTYIAPLTTALSAKGPVPSPVTGKTIRQHPRFVRPTTITIISSQERLIRGQITTAMDNEMALDVHEEPPGSNRGPRVDIYTDYPDNRWKSVDSREWCAAFDSTVFLEAGMPLSGGVLYGKHNPDYLLLRAGKAANPHEKIHITSVMDWFEQDGYFYPNNGHTPRPGDAVFMHYFNSKGLEEWHTGLVRQVTGNGDLVTYEGNVGDALEKRVYANFQNSSYIYGFGSFFQEK